MIVKNLIDNADNSTFIQEARAIIEKSLRKNEDYNRLNLLIGYLAGYSVHTETDDDGVETYYLYNPDGKWIVVDFICYTEEEVFDCVPNFSHSLSDTIPMLMRLPSNMKWGIESFNGSIKIYIDTPNKQILRITDINSPHSIAMNILDVWLQVLEDIH